MGECNNYWASAEASINEASSATKYARSLDRVRQVFKVKWLGLVEAHVGEAGLVQHVWKRMLPV